jgi:hypothetical protein
LLPEVILGSPQVIHRLDDVGKLPHLIVRAAVIVSRVLAPVLGVLVVRLRDLHLL